MARKRNSGDFGAKIKNLRWAGARHFFGAVGAGSQAQLFVSDGTTETIMRIRGELTCWVDGLEAPAVSATIGVGLLVVQAGSGTTVIQEPITDAQAPWFMYETFNVGYEEMVVDTVDVPGLTMFRKVIDVKAQRILRPGREVQMVVENLTNAGAVSVNINFAFRALLGTH